MKDKSVAFDDPELRNWLIDLIADGSQDFLCALAEAVLAAKGEDYGLIRPVLVELKRKYADGVRNRVPGRRFFTGRGMPPESHRARRQTQ